MDFIKFLENISKTNECKYLIEEAIIPGYKSLFEEEVVKEQLSPEQNENFRKEMFKIISKVEIFISNYYRALEEFEDEVKGELFNIENELETLFKQPELKKSKYFSDLYLGGLYRQLQRTYEELNRESINDLKQENKDLNGFIQNKDYVDEDDESFLEDIGNPQIEPTTPEETDKMLDKNSKDKDALIKLKDAQLQLQNNEKEVVTNASSGSTSNSGSSNINSDNPTAEEYAASGNI